MDFRSLETLVWIARLGSFRAAAKHLYTSQPSVSARISNLEEELGVRLFERAGRRVALTAKGRDTLEYAERMLELRSELLHTVADPQAMQGTIRLGVVETIVYTWLPHLLERLNEAYPGVTLELDVDRSLNLTDKLTGHDIDIAFLMGPVNHPDIVNSELCRYPLSWVASPRLPLPPEPVPLDALTRWPIITYPRLSKPHIAVQQLVRGTTPGLRIHASSSLATIIRMTVDGIGISPLPPRIIGNELASGTLRTFEAEGALPELRFTVSYAIAPGDTITRAVAELAIRVASEHP